MLAIWIVLILWIVMPIVASVIARNKGRSVGLWVFLTMITPIVLLILLVLPAKPKAGAQKTCPECAETVLSAARICRHCGYEFAAHSIPQAHQPGHLYP